MTSRCAVVTGGTKGIGLAVVHELLAHDHDVMVLAGPGASTDSLEKVGSDRLGWIVGDVTDADTRQQLVDQALTRFGGIDVLVNNAGIAPSPRRDVLEVPLDSYDKVMDVNLRGPFALTQLVARQMISQRPPDAGPGAPHAAIVNIGSSNGTLVAVDRAEYCLSKAGVAMLTEILAVRLAPEGIHVHQVVPGIIATDMTSVVAARYDTMIGEGRLPVARWGRPEDVAQAVRILASNELSYSTGQTITVDGGMLIPVM
ncbi:MAG: 3-ketoacyl-ACP reductase [Beutenbergiaceae bacterium]